MPYITQEEIIKRRIPEDELIQLTDDSDLDTVDSDVVASIIAEQDELIDGYLRQRYELPLASVPGFIAGIAVDLCTYALYQRRAHIETPETIINSRRDALSMLKQIQRGELALDVAITNSETSAGASFVANDRRFSRDSLRDM